MVDNIFDGDQKVRQCWTEVVVVVRGLYSGGQRLWWWSEGEHRL